MQDLTDSSSSIVRSIPQMALPIAAGMFFQTVYALIDLYFVAGLGDRSARIGTCLRRDA
jgi:Na+-driven multidrug efflux pump